MSSSDQPTTFLNVDVDLEAGSGLDMLLEALGDAIIVLHKSETTAAFELGKLHSSLEEAVANTVALVRVLPLDVRALWDACESRRLNIGIQGGTSPREMTFTLSEVVANSLAEVGFGIIFTVYAAS